MIGGVLPIGFGWIKFAVTRDHHKKKVVRQGNFCRKIQVGETAWWSKAPFFADLQAIMGPLPAFSSALVPGGFRGRRL